MYINIKFKKITASNILIYEVLNLKKYHIRHTKIQRIIFAIIQHNTPTVNLLKKSENSLPLFSFPLSSTYFLFLVIWLEFSTSSSLSYNLFRLSRPIFQRNKSSKKYKNRNKQCDNRRGESKWVVLPIFGSWIGLLKLGIKAFNRRKKSSSTVPEFQIRFQTLKWIF